MTEDFREGAALNGHRISPCIISSALMPCSLAILHTDRVHSTTNMGMEFKIQPVSHKSWCTALNKMLIP